MIHNHTEDDGLYAVNVNADKNAVLAQIGEGKETTHRQSRAILTPDEARHFADLLRNAADAVENKVNVDGTIAKAYGFKPISEWTP